MAGWDDGDLEGLGAGGVPPSIGRCVEGRNWMSMAVLLRKDVFQVTGRDLRESTVSPIFGTM